MCSSDHDPSTSTNDERVLSAHWLPDPVLLTLKGSVSVKLRAGYVLPAPCHWCCIVIVLAGRARF